MKKTLLILLLAGTMLSLASFTGYTLYSRGDVDQDGRVGISDVIAGKSIDSDRTQGNVTIPAGVEYEIEASGVVRLEDGFKVEKGATFAVYPSSF